MAKPKGEPPSLELVTREAGRLARRVEKLRDAAPQKDRKTGDTHPTRMQLNHALDMAQRAYLALRDDVPNAKKAPRAKPE